MQRPIYLILLTMLALAMPSYGQTNLLLNPGFEEPTLASCTHDTSPVTAWFTAGGGNWANRNDTLYIPTPCAYSGNARLSMQGWGSTPSGVGVYVYQTVSGLTPGTIYTLSGWWWPGHMDSYGNNTVTAEMHDGTDPNSALIVQAQRVQGQGDPGTWVAFSVNGAALSSQMTVVLRSKNSGATGWALHVDDVQLVEATCLEPPRIDTIAVPGRDTAFGIRGETLTGVTITGSNLTPNKTSVKLKSPGNPDITATNVAATGSSLTCTLDLTGAPWGRYDVEVSVADTAPNQLNCGPDTLSGGFLVVLPALSNPSFENPPAAGGCPLTPLAGFPTDWHAKEIAGYGWENVLLRDSDQFVPSCPPPDGAHYASSLSTNDGGAGAFAEIYQTVAVTPGSLYVVSGQFAGGGNNIVTIRLVDGDINSSTTLGTTTVHNPGGAYDWTFASVVATPPTQPYVTVVWKIDPEGAGPHAAHADALSLDLCTNPITVTGITPNVGANTGPVNITNLAGTGFQVPPAPPPTVTLRRPGTTITATDVTVLSSTQITCTFDLTGKPAGAYQVMVADGPCIGSYSSFVIVSDPFTNGSFEQGDPGNSADMPGWGLLVERPGATIEKTLSGANGSIFGGIDTTWDGQFYAGYGVATAEPFHVALYQVFRTLPGTEYTVTGGYFGGVGPPSPDPVNLGLAWWEVLVVDGGNLTIADMNGTGGTPTLIAKKEHLAGDPSMSFRETFAGSFTAISDATTVFLKWGYVPGDYAIHLAGWDDLAIKSSCNDPFADADGDGDVDQVDFAVFQLCLTDDLTSPPPVPRPEYCLCFNRPEDLVPDNDIDQADWTKFEACASGPGILADKNCDN